MTAQIEDRTVNGLSDVVSLETSAAAAPAGRQRMATILLATDLSAASERATEAAISMCRALDARLVVVNVIDNRHGIVPGFLPVARGPRIDQVRAEREQLLLGLVQRARSHGVDASFLLWSGDAGPGIVSAAEAENADMVVVGTRALDRAGRFLLGSVSDYVVNNARSPVLIAR